MVVTVAVRSVEDDDGQLGHLSRWNILMGGVVTSDHAALLSGSWAQPGWVMSPTPAGSHREVYQAIELITL